MNQSNKKLANRDVYFFRQRLKNKVFQSVLSYFSKLSKEEGLTKKDLATLLGKDPSQITRWFSGPNNWTLDTISDLLFAMDAEVNHQIIPIHKEKEQENVNYNIEKSALEASYFFPIVENVKPPLISSELFDDEYRLNRDSAYNELVTKEIKKVRPKVFIVNSASNAVIPGNKTPKLDYNKAKYESQAAITSQFSESKH
jgi:transcriptional regulator with XRE-family HTH domain